MARRRASYLPSSPNLMLTRLTICAATRIRVLRRPIRLSATTITCLSCATRPRRTPYWYSGEAHWAKPSRHNQATIACQPTGWVGWTASWCLSRMSPALHQPESPPPLPSSCLKTIIKFVSERESRRNMPSSIDSRHVFCEATKTGPRPPFFWAKTISVCRLARLFTFSRGRWIVVQSASSEVALDLLLLLSPSLLLCT